MARVLGAALSLYYRLLARYLLYTVLLIIRTPPLSILFLGAPARSQPLPARYTQKRITHKLCPLKNVQCAPASQKAALKRPMVYLEPHVMPAYPWSVRPDDHPLGRG